MLIVFGAVSEENEYYQHPTICRSIRGYNIYLKFYAEAILSKVVWFAYAVKLKNTALGSFSPKLLLSHRIYIANTNAKYEWCTYTQIYPKTCISADRQYRIFDRILSLVSV